MAKLARTDIVYKKKSNQWVAERNGRKVDSAAKKSTLVSRVAKKAKASRGTSLRIHKRNGQIQEERAYPRPADPGGSKG